MMVSPDTAECAGRLCSGGAGGDGERGGTIGMGVGSVIGRLTLARLRGPPLALEIDRLIMAMRPPPTSKGVGAPAPMLGAADGC